MEEMGKQCVRPHSRIPVVAAAGLRLDQVVEVREGKGRIVIEPVSPEERDLSDLLAGITPENVHDEADFGAPVGNKAL